MFVFSRVVLIWFVATQLPTDLSSTQIALLMSITVAALQPQHMTAPMSLSEHPSPSVSGKESQKWHLRTHADSITVLVNNSQIRRWEIEPLFLWFPALAHPVFLVAVLGLMHQEAAWERNQTQGDECSEIIYHDTVRVLMSCSQSLLHPWVC